MASRSKKIGMETSLPASPARQYSDEEYMDALVVARQRRDEGDIQDLFRLILASPVKPGEKMVEVDGKKSLTELSNENTSVIARVGITASIRAMGGDVSFAKMMLDYAGFKPVERKDVSISTPIIIDDLAQLPDASKRPNTDVTAGIVDAEIVSAKDGTDGSPDN